MEKRDIYSPVRKEQVLENTSKYLIFVGSTWLDIYLC